MVHGQQIAAEYNFYELFQGTHDIMIPTKRMWQKCGLTKMCKL